MLLPSLKSFFLRRDDKNCLIPGGAQMICASFSPGGLFLATGSADHHVRVYMMDGKVSLVFLDQLINV